MTPVDRVEGATEQPDPHGVGGHGAMEYWSAGVLGFKVVTPLLHRSITPVLNLLLFPNLPIPKHDEFGRRELLKSHRAKGVNLARADTDLGAESQLATVIESRRGIHHHRGRVHPVDEFPRSFVIRGHNRFSVRGSVALDVIDRLV